MLVIHNVEFAIKKPSLVAMAVVNCAFKYELKRQSKNNMLKTEGIISNMRPLYHKLKALFMQMNVEIDEIRRLSNNVVCFHKNFIGYTNEIKNL